MLRPIVIFSREEDMNVKFLVPILVMLGAGFAALSTGMAPAHNPGDAINSGDTAWLLSASTLVMLMTPGLAFFYGGMVRKKNVISTMLQSVIALGIISFIWVVFGFSLAFGDTIGGIIGNPSTFLFLKGVGAETQKDLAPTIPFMLFCIFQLKFAIITPALITGAFAERIKFWGYLLFIALFSIFIYAPLAHLTWHPSGILRNWGVLDFAGGTVVHIAGGMAALAGAFFFGPRKDLGHSGHTPAKVPYVILGTGLLWFGWFGFNAGSSLAANAQGTSAFLNTNTASALAMLTWILLEAFNGKKPSAVGACVGAVVGLVAITPAAGFVTVGASMIIGIVGSACAYFAVQLKNKLGVDDTLDVFPCHGVGGMVGMLMTGIFAKDVGLYYGETKTFFNHLLALVLVSAFVFVGSYVLYWVTNAIIPMKTEPKEAEEGLDLSQHAESMP